MKRIKLHGKYAQGEYEYALVDDEVHGLLEKFTWYAKPMNGKRSDKVYAKTDIWLDGKKRQVLMHRLITNAYPNQLVDHRNGHSVDNQEANLRPATHTENGQNIYKSWHKGVSYDPRWKVWWVRIKVNGRQVGGGTYDTEEDAAIAYNHAAVKYFGEAVNEGNLNRIPNWREATPKPHIKRRYIYKSNTTGVPGLTFHKRTGKWDANIGGKQTGLQQHTLYLGRFSSKDEAIKARRDAELKYWGHTDIPEELTMPASTTDTSGT